MIKRRLDLTGDRPLPLREARALARWWQGYTLYDVVITRAGHRFYHVVATRNF